MLKPNEARTNIMATKSLPGVIERQGRSLLGRNSFMRSRARHMSRSVTSQRAISMETREIWIRLTSVEKEVTAQWPSAMVTKLATKKKAARQVVTMATARRLQ